VNLFPKIRYPIAERLLRTFYAAQERQQSVLTPKRS
jgi:hypothetical protein